MSTQCTQLNYHSHSTTADHKQVLSRQRKKFESMIIPSAALNQCSHPQRYNPLGRWLSLLSHKHASPSSPPYRSKAELCAVPICQLEQLRMHVLPSPYKTQHTYIELLPANIMACVQCLLYPIHASHTSFPPQCPS